MDWKQRRSVIDAFEKNDFVFTNSTTEAAGNSTTPYVPEDGSNVGLIVGLSVGITALLSLVCVLLYLTRAKWLPYSSTCTAKCSCKKRQTRRNRTQEPAAQRPAASFPSRLSSQARAAPALYPEDSASEIGVPISHDLQLLNPYSLLIDQPNPSLRPGLEQTTPLTPRVVGAGGSNSAPAIPVLPPRLPSRRQDAPAALLRPAPRAPPASQEHRPPPGPWGAAAHPSPSGPTQLNSSQIAAEFGRLQSVELPCEVAASPSNRSRNRFLDTLPFDFNRVVLSSGQYINASHIDRDFIVTQDPMMVVDDDDILWSMVWEKDVHIIVRLSADDTHLNSQLRCATYMPVGRYVFQNSLEVKLVSGPSDELHYVYRAVRLAKTAGQDKGERGVAHYHLKNWNSRRPPPPLDFLRVLCLIRERYRGLLQQTSSSADAVVPRILVHCGAGSSRSGTFIAVWRCMERVDSAGAPDVPQVVQSIRSQRAQAVNKLELYEYVYECVRLYSAQRLALTSSDIYDLYSAPP